jgi:predicted ATPase/transcriptional regulator with XRE-family HTH domain
VNANPTFGRLLKRGRRAAHLTQEDLAARAGYSAHYVSMLERGVRFPQPLTVDVLADALTLAPDDRATFHAAATPRPREPAPVPRVSPPASPLVGRADDLARVVGMLRGGVHFLTLTGPGGVGKTSLAREAAAALASGFPDGTALVDLAGVSDPSEILPAIARSLALREMGGRPIGDRLVARLRGRTVLLVLDGFERVAEGGAAVGRLLDDCPHVRVLVTSRVPLRLRVEREVRLGPLVLPRAGRPEHAGELLQSPAVALFVQRAQLVHPEFALDDENAAVIADICRRLDGLPLAIELAAARISHLPVTALRDRLSHRLGILTGGPRDAPARQQRMRDTIALSYDLLTHPERVLFRQLSVFAGGWTLEAAEAVCGASMPEGDVLDDIRALVEHSLVIPADGTLDEPRYRMLDTIHEYATERLVAAGERDEVRRRHSAYFARLAELAEPALRDRAQRVWYPRLEREQDNLRAALDWLLHAGEAEPALRLAGALWRFWQRHGDIREGRAWLEGCLAAEGAVPALVRARALWGASWLAYHQGDYAGSRSFSAQLLALAREDGDALSLRNALTGLGMADLAEGKVAEAARWLREAVDACAPLGKAWHYASSILNLGNATLLLGDLTDTEALFEEAEGRYREQGDEVFAARARQHLGYVALVRGEYSRADTLFAESLRRLADLGEWMGVADGLEAAATVAAARGDAARAGRFVGAASALRERLGLAPLAYLYQIWRPFVARAEERLGVAAWAAACAEGRALSIEAAVECGVGGDGSE